MFGHKTAHTTDWTRTDRWWIQRSPFGPLPVVLGERGLRRVGLDSEARPQLITALSDSKAIRLKAGIAQISAQLEAYFKGSLKTFDLPLDPLLPEGFSRRAVLALADIPYGATWSYGQLATHIGKPSAARAVGGAMGRNPLPLLLPCHRVVASGGGIGGFTGGLAIKRALLALEARHSGLEAAEPPADSPRVA
jgi:methylated-DNA-[protein]-cysteine S-methyltransferase